MNLNDLHRRLLRDVLEIGNALPFVITGGYAVQAHGLVDRLSQDIDVATDSFQPMEEIASILVNGLTERNWRVHVIGIQPVSARLMVTDPDSGESCEVDILREAFNQPPDRTPYGPVLGLDDVIGTKIRALANRGYPRDLIDIRAAARIRSTSELEFLGRTHTWDEFSLEDLAARLEGSMYIEDEDFAWYGLTEEEALELRCWAQTWADDIRRRLFTETFVEEGEDWP
ncbi:MAG: nucleotidyl transferase AbiEii/AbiGii toxin family protein [Nocardiopsaceae bacterium]|nr:nucleotidyl transferase AbiEii/AbiGii toxin family protein [Nocardiopsaceae bacterium]